MGARLDPKRVMPILQAALREDIGTRDLTSSAIIPSTATTKAEIIACQPGIVAGVPLVEWACGLLDRGIRVKPMVREGDAVNADKALVFLEGPARPILSGERTFLNIISRLSGIATLTRAFVERAKPYPVKILDTRKTTPTLRYLEKYAVAVGGGYNHRMGLYDQVLIKENHLQVIAQAIAAEHPGRHVAHTEVIADVLARATKAAPRGIKVEVEVRNLEEFRVALEHGAALILLDNMPPEELREAVRLRQESGNSAAARGSASARASQKVLLEASGGVTLDTVAAVAATGVDFISIGALTRDAPGLDVALDIV